MSLLKILNCSTSARTGFSHVRQHSQHQALHISRGHCPAHTTTKSAEQCLPFSLLLGPFLSADELRCGKEKVRWKPYNTVWAPFTRRTHTQGLDIVLGMPEAGGLSAAGEQWCRTGYSFSCSLAQAALLT